MTQRTCRTCGKEISQSEFDNGTIRTIEGSDFTMYHHITCLGASAPEAAQEDTTDYTDTFAPFIAQIENAKTNGAVDWVMGEMKTAFNRLDAQLHRDGIDTTALRTAAQKAFDIGKAKMKSFQAPKVEINQPKISFIDALAAGEKIAQRYENC